MLATILRLTGPEKSLASATSGIQVMTQILILTIAIVLIGVSTGQFFVAGIQTKRIDRRLKERRTRRLKKLRSAARVARMTSELNARSQSLQGNQWRVVEVARVVDESVDTKSFILVDPYQQEFPSFYPGQYLMVRPALAGSYQATRCYSISVSPKKNLWRITVKRQTGDVSPRPDRKSGALSCWLHDNIQEGDCLLVGGPAGQFYLPPDNMSPLVLLAAGVGITPMNSILQYSLAETPCRPVSLYYQVKDLQHWPLGREVHACAGKSNDCRVVTFISRSDLADLCPPDSLPGQFCAGRIDATRIASESKSVDSHYYLCGPEAWMQQMRNDLMTSGVQEAHIHWESFGGGQATATHTDHAANSYGVEFRKSGLTARWEAPEQSLWELAQANGVVIPSGCLSGVCGSCRVNVLKGSVEYDRNVQLSLQERECLPCVARPIEDLVIDA